MRKKEAAPLDGESQGKVIRYKIGDRPQFPSFLIGCWCSEYSGAAMPRRPRVVLPHIPLHLIQRGNNRQVW